MAFGGVPRVGYYGPTYRNQSEEAFRQKHAELSEQLLTDVAISGAAFGATAKAGYAERSYAAVWTSDWTFEASLIQGSDPVDHLRKCKELIAQGYRPVSWSANEPASEAALLTASVWHSPIITDEIKDKLAERQARQPSP